MTTEVLHLVTTQNISTTYTVGLIMAAVCGFVGTFAVMRRLTLMADTLAHGSLAGVGLAYAFGWPPQSMILPYSAFLATVLTWFSRHRRQNLVAISAMAFSVSVGLGILMLNHAGVADADEFVHILFGDLMSMSQQDMNFLLIFGLPAVAFLWWQRRKLILIFLNEDLAVSAGVKPARFDYAFMICLAITVAVCLKLVGVILVMTLMNIPSLIAARLTRSFQQQLWMSPLVAMACTFVGMAASTTWNLPCGACIAITCGSVFLLVTLLRPAH